MIVANCHFGSSPFLPYLFLYILLTFASFQFLLSLPFHKHMAIIPEKILLVIYLIEFVFVPFHGIQDVFKNDMYKLDMDKKELYCKIRTYRGGCKPTRILGPSICYHLEL